MKYTKNSARRYSEEFKQQAIELLLAGNMSMNQVAHELGVTIDSIRMWKAYNDVHSATISSGKFSCLRLRRNRAELYCQGTGRPGPTDDTRDHRHQHTGFYIGVKGISGFVGKEGEKRGNQTLNC